MKNTEEIYLPGKLCLVSGWYAVVWLPLGIRTGIEKIVMRGEKFPPTLKRGQGYVLVRVTEI